MLYLRLKTWDPMLSGKSQPLRFEWLRLHGLILRDLGPKILDPCEPTLTLADTSLSKRDS